MIKNNLLTALRNLRRHKVFSLINLLGLSIGMSASLVIYLVVQYDFSFEKFQKDGSRIYRVVTDMKMAGDPFPNSGVPFPLPEAVRKELTGVEETAHFWTASPKVAIPAPHQGKPIVFKRQDNDPGGIFADPHYFRIFPFYTWLAGSPANALQDPFHVVLTESRARIYFPGMDPSGIIGREIIYNDTIPVTVTGIVKDLTENTDFTFTEFISLSTITHGGLKKEMSVDQWNNINSSSQFFIRLAPGTAPKQVEAQVASIRAKYEKPSKEKGFETIHHLQPLNDVHFNATYDNFDQRIAHKPTLYGLMLIAAFLLVLACINFINLNTALAGQRAKEIGIRKTLGGSVGQLITQFLGEAFLLTLCSLALSLLLTPWLLHVFSDFIPRGVHFNPGQQPGLILFSALLLVIVTLLSGFYPALVLSRFQPVQVLKNQAYSGTGSTRKAWLRKTLTVSQFVIAQVFIMATLIVGRQIRFSLNTDLGFKKEGIVYLNTPFKGFRPDPKQLVLLEKIRAIPGIERAALGSNPPSSGSIMSSTMKYEDGKKVIQTDVQIKRGDSNYIKIYQIRLLAGRNISSSDSAGAWIINQTYARILGFQNPGDAIGRKIADNRVVGVMADFHQASLRTPIKPLALEYNQYDRYIHIALAPQDPANPRWKTILARVEKSYKETYPDGDYHIQFFDESIAKFYASEEKISRLLKWASGLTILISCLGLLGLVSFSHNQRIKEIGIRKVLGASVMQIVSILSTDFLKLVSLAFIIAIPLAVWAAHKWLENFAYKAPLSWWLFPLCGGVMILIALVTLSYQTIRAAVSNPVDSLRNE